MPENEPYWFSSKVFGFGWGLPTAWQGWVVYAIFLVLCAVVAVAFPPSSRPDIFAACILFLAVLLVGVCWLKGEPPRWRWGGK
jgi:amino acid transporter